MSPEDEIRTVQSEWDRFYALGKERVIPAMDVIAAARNWVDSGGIGPVGELVEALRAWDEAREYVRHARGESDEQG